jgi:electron transfer flavoprotein alpha subunit
MQVADNSVFANPVAEDIAKVAGTVAKGYTHVLTPSSGAGKNFLPRLAAQLDVSPLNDVSAVVDENTFKRPTYAGNAVATVTMSDSVKVVLYTYLLESMNILCGSMK